MNTTPKTNGSTDGKPNPTQKRETWDLGEGIEKNLFRNIFSGSNAITVFQKRNRGADGEDKEQKLEHAVTVLNIDRAVELAEKENRVAVIGVSVSYCDEYQYSYAMPVSKFREKYSKSKDSFPLSTKIRKLYDNDPAVIKNFDVVIPAAKKKAAKETTTTKESTTTTPAPRKKDAGDTYLDAKWRVAHKDLIDRHQEKHPSATRDNAALAVWLAEEAAKKSAPPPPEVAKAAAATDKSTAPTTVVNKRVGTFPIVKKGNGKK